jgi:serine/threonine protein kinase
VLSANFHKLTWLAGEHKAAAAPRPTLAAQGITTPMSNSPTGEFLEQLASDEPRPMIRWPVAGEVIRHERNEYTIGEQLGEGSYGATFACTDQWRNWLVIKVLIPRGQTYEQVRNNWQREITSLFSLRHPNITYVYDAFELDQTFHIVMERCGGSLSQLFTTPDYDGDEWLLPIARCMLQGIGYMHDNGYIHKDIHLRNVYWAYVRNELTPSHSESVTFKIGDLGITRFEHEVQSVQTTVPWMVAPEVLEPDVFGTVGKRTDLYHAGMVLLAVGLGIEPSFTADEIVSGVPREAALQLAAPFGAAIGRALQLQVAMRPQSAFEFWQLLTAEGSDER